MDKAIVRQAGEGERRWFAGGGLFTMKATSEETAGSLMLIEDRMVRGKMTPLHLHPDNDEAIYVLDGELLVDIEGERHEVGPGGFFFAPRGLPHAFMVTSESAHVLGLMTPAAEDFYRDASDPSDSDEDAARPGDFERLRAAAERWPSIEILGPPPFVAATA